MYVNKLGWNRETQHWFCGIAFDILTISDQMDIMSILSSC
jgi:hypothetical protein